jgi:hypothetical protein
MYLLITCAAKHRRRAVRAQIILSGAARAAKPLTVFAVHNGGSASILSDFRRYSA